MFPTIDGVSSPTTSLRLVFSSTGQGSATEGGPTFLSEDDVARAYPWPEFTTDQPRWLRAMMVTTLDGAATGPDGLSGSISPEADQVVFRAVRRFADAVLVGAHTLRAEQYTPMRARPDDAQERAAHGQQPAPTIVTVSGSLDLPWDLPVWTESTQQPIVLTASTDAERLKRAGEHAEVIALPDTEPHTVVAAIVERGLPRINCEGGPRLLRDLTAAGLVDELDLTVSPLLAGTATTPETPALRTPANARLLHVLEGDGCLMTRYLLGDR